MSGLINTNGTPTGGVIPNSGLSSKRTLISANGAAIQDPGHIRPIST